MDNDLKELQKRVLDYRDKRDWAKFHNPKDLALSLTLESTELLELFQWKSLEEMDEYVKKHKDKIEEEVADVFYCILLFSGHLKIDLIKAFNKKMRENNRKYPVEKVKGKNKKYSEY
jgi:NTP pyrophosphatase (non-canonical NTP hydrolase)